MSADELQAKLKALGPEQIRRLMAKRRDGGAMQAERPAEYGQEFPASLGQERFWFLSKLYPDTPDYNIPLAVLVDGDGVDAGVLQHNLNAVVAAHEIFRTTFHQQSAGVMQRVHPSLELEVELEDRSVDYAAEGEGLIERLAKAHGQRRFATDQLPLLAIALVRLSTSRHLLLLNIHHLISDGWSNSLLSRSLTVAPGASIPRPQRQYRDFVAHERTWLAGEECRRQLDFWLDVLRDAPSPPVFRAAAAADMAANAGGLFTIDLPQALCSRIASCCSALGRTQFQYYATCFALLLSRYAMVDDIVIGSPVANRSRPEFLQTCGLFINTLALRFRIDPARSFGQILAEGAAMIEACLARQELPYAELVKHIQVQRTLDENPLFNVQFAFQYFPHQKASADFRLLSVDHGVGKFDLGGYVEISGAGNRLSLAYRHRAFARVDVERIAADFMHVLEYGLQPEPGSLLANEFLPAASLAQLDGPSMQRPGGNWFGLFERQVERHADRPACIDEAGALDYATLDEMVERVAAALRGQGVQPGDRVLLRAPRNRHFLIGLLACLRTGAAYVPVAQDAPHAIERMLEHEAGARLVLGTPGIGALAQLSYESALACKPLTRVPPVEVADDDAAYVVFTSGSTGAPKGVVVTHAGLVNYTLSLLERLADPELASYAHLSALDADLGNTAIFPALASGAALLLPDAQTLLDAQRLGAFYLQHRVDVAKMVPSHLRVLRSRLREILPRRVLISGGEALDESLIAAIRACAPDLRIFNHYGPAETTIGVLMHELAIDAQTAPPLGTPIANTRVCVLDRHGRAAPRGSQGELAISGAGVARGYLGQVAADAPRFVSARDGTRQYLSGDRASLIDGAGFVFLGRGDNRAKVGGVMVQPEAIAGCLMRHPAVVAAQVWAEAGDDGNLRLQGAVVVREDVELRHLRAYLLQHFRPAQCPALVVLPSMPLNANGKLDSRALRRMCEGGGVRGGIDLPRDAVELELQRLFQQALGVAAVACEPTFFDLGGTSLQAIALIARVNEVYALELPVAVLFQSGSVRSLAEAVRRGGAAGRSDSPLVVLEDAGQDELMVWIHPAGGNALCYLPIARQLAPRRASIAFMGMPQGNGMQIAELARDYHERLAVHRGTRKVVLAGWSMGALIAHEMAAQAAAEGKPTALMMLDQPVPDIDAAKLDFDTRVEQYLRKVEIFAGQALRQPPASVRRSDAAWLLPEFQRLDLVPPDTQLAHFKAFLELLVHHNEIIAAFTPRVLHSPALLLRAREQVALQGTAPVETDFGWSSFCTALDVAQARGNHMTMLQASNAASLAVEIECWLAALP